jgi:hypothetical protein
MARQLKSANGRDLDPEERVIVDFLILAPGSTYNEVCLGISKSFSFCYDHIQLLAKDGWLRISKTNKEHRIYATDRAKKAAKIWTLGRKG